MSFRRRFLSLSRHISTFSAKIPLLYKPKGIADGKTITVDLLSWGRGASGQLGGGIEEIRLYPSPVATFLVPSSSFAISLSPGQLPVPHTDRALYENEVVNLGVSCGLFHSALLVDGRIWIWGKGDGGRLGLGHENPLFVPTLNPNLRDVRRIALGGLHSVVLDSLGQIFTWGYGGFGALGHRAYHRELLPKLMEGPWKDKICHIATSGTHTAAITESGEVYTWGRDEGDGRLGLGPGRGPNEAGGLSIPSQVKALPFPVGAVCCGGFFTMALSREGQLWNWGANSNYELGRGDKVGGWKPQPVPSLQDVHITQIACGGYHSLALTDEGKVLSWGHGGHGQLGHPSIQNQNVPTVIEALANEHVIYIACGGSSSAAVTEKGKLYMWGNAKDSQLGSPGFPEVQPFPIEVKFLVENGEESFHVLHVAVGASHAMCLVASSGCSKSRGG